MSTSPNTSFTNREFIEFCYTRVLGRPPEEAVIPGLEQRLQSGNLSREALLMSLLTCDEFESTRKNREAFPSGHFFSALPSAEERQHYRRNLQCELIPGIDLNESKQAQLAQIFAEYYPDCPLAREPTTGKRYYGSNNAFPYSDAFILHSFIRHLRPRKVVEIGSGFSSAALLDTLNFIGAHETECCFIDPYPALLSSLLQPQDSRHVIIPQRVQEAPTNLFQQLERGDILFIDSTHVSKVDSDVNHEIFKILPLLKPGVIVHIHDIYWPFDYPEEWIREGRAWTEAYLVRAFLQYNPRFKILYFNSYLHPRIRASIFGPNSLDLGPNDGGSLWLEVI